MSPVSIGQVESEEQRPVVLIGSMVALCEVSAHLSLPPAVPAIRVTCQSPRSTIRHSFPDFPTLQVMRLIFRAMRAHQEKRPSPSQRSGSYTLKAAVLLKYGNQAFGTFSSHASSQDHKSGAGLSGTSRLMPNRYLGQIQLRSSLNCVLVSFVMPPSRKAETPKRQSLPKLKVRVAKIKRPGRRAYDGKTRGAETHHSRRR
jgi:hypothetical protein